MKDRERPREAPQPDQASRCRRVCKEPERACPTLHLFLRIFSESEGVPRLLLRGASQASSRPPLLSCQSSPSLPGDGASTLSPHHPLIAPRTPEPPDQLSASPLPTPCRQQQDTNLQTQPPRCCSVYEAAEGLLLLGVAKRRPKIRSLPPRHTPVPPAAGSPHLSTGLSPAHLSKLTHRPGIVFKHLSISIDILLACFLFPDFSPLLEISQGPYLSCLPP